MIAELANTGLTQISDDAIHIKIGKKSPFSEVTFGPRWRLLRQMRGLIRPTVRRALSFLRVGRRSQSKRSSRGYHGHARTG